PVFTTGNRSGWAGVALIALLVLGSRRNFKATLVLALVAGAAYYLVTDEGVPKVLQLRMEQTVSGYSSDDLRKELFSTAMAIAVENPILGMSPGGLPLELARRLDPEIMSLDPHNVIGHIAGGSGF